MSDLDYYALLGVTPYASAREIDQAYQTLVDRLGSGPDVCQTLLALISEAHQTLIDSRQRAAYDHGRTSPAPAPAAARSAASSYLPVHDEVTLRYLKGLVRRRRIIVLSILAILLLGIILWWGSTFPT